LQNVFYHKTPEEAERTSRGKIMQVN